MTYSRRLDKNIKISPLIHKELKVLSVNIDCRMDFLATYAISEFLKKQQIAHVEDQEEYKKAKMEFESTG
jgi:hypothetical protein